MNRGGKSWFCGFDGFWVSKCMVEVRSLVFFSKGYLKWFLNRLFYWLDIEIKVWYFVYKLWLKKLFLSLFRGCVDF